MTERLDFGGADYDDCEEYLDYDNGHDDQDDHEEGDQLKYSETSDDEYVGEDLGEKVQEAVEHQTDSSEEKGAEFDSDDAKLGARGRARRASRGQKWIPEDTRLRRAPVFVRLSDIVERVSHSSDDLHDHEEQDRNEDDRQERREQEYIPWFYNGPDDE